MDYGNVFSRAWRICWNNKYMFVLGFLAALGSGSSGGFRGFSGGAGDEQLPPGVLENIDRVLALMGPILAALACIGLILGIVFWLIRLVAQVGLIDAAARLDRKENFSLGRALSAGTAYLPRFVGLNILIFLPFWILAAVSIGLGIFGFGASVASVLGANSENLGALPTGFALVAICGLALLCILAPLFLLALIVYAFAQRGIVLQDMGVTQSIGHSWRFVREHAGEVLLLIIFLIVLSMIYGALVSVVMIPLSLLAFGPVFIDLFRGATLDTIDLVIAGAGFIAIALVGALLNAIFIAFRSAAVTLGYHDLLSKPATKANVESLST